MKEAFEKEQETLRRKYYYRREYGNKLALFAAEMTIQDRTIVRAETTRAAVKSGGEPSNKQR